MSCSSFSYATLAGPSAHEESTASLPLNFAFVFSSWCADLVMVRTSVHLDLLILLLTVNYHKIWRCIVVYRNTKVYPVIVGFGIILFLAAFSMCQTYLCHSPSS